MIMGVFTPIPLYFWDRKRRYLEYNLAKVQSMNNVSDLSEKVLKGVRKALRKLVETSAANNQELVVGDKYGNFKSVPAKDLLKRLPE